MIFIIYLEQAAKFSFCIWRKAEIAVNDFFPSVLLMMMNTF